MNKSKFTSLEKLQKQIEKADLRDQSRKGAIQASELENIANIALEPLIPEIRNMLVDNYNKAGLTTGNKDKDKRGPADLLSAIQGAKIWVRVMSDGHIYIRFAFKGGMPDRTYIAGDAINSGSIQHSNLGKRVKRTLKKKINLKSGSQKLGGGVVVRSGKHYWELNSGQLADISKKLFENIANLQK